MKETTKKKIGLKIKALRESRRLSQEELSEKCNVCWRTISNIERGVSIPQLQTLVELSNFFGIGLDCFLDISVVGLKKQAHKELEALVVEKVAMMNYETLKYTSAQIDLILEHLGA